jgi:hypothetical protein
MEVWLIALLLAAHLAFWGAGLAWLTMPRRWRAFWPLLVPAAGLGLQSAVVWWGAVAGAAGTDVYGRWVQLALNASPRKPEVLEVSSVDFSGRKVLDA